MTRRLSVEWPDARPFAGRDGRPFRILAVSDQLDPVLSDGRTRRALGSIDLIVGCGDLDCDDLTFLADGFDAPLVYVLGNHDGDERWAQCETYCPSPMKSGRVKRESGLVVAGLDWPGKRGQRSSRSEFAAWRQAASLALRRFRRSDPLLIVTHAPPHGAGDVTNGEFHRGFDGYRWLLRRIRPRLWLHGHTPLAAATEWRIDVGGTTLVNVTEAVVVELLAPGRRSTEVRSLAGAPQLVPDPERSPSPDAGEPEPTPAGSRGRSAD